MSARDKLRNCFPALPEGASNDLIEKAVDEILNDHAHELAEKQRAALAANPGILEHELIALIDPQKEGQ